MNRQLATKYRPDMRILYEFVNTAARDMLEGRGGPLAGSDRKINQIMPLVPGLDKLRTVASVNRDLHFSLLNLSDPQQWQRQFLSMRDIENRVYAATVNVVGESGEDEYEDVSDELDELADSFEVPLQVTPPLVAAHMAHKHAVTSALALLQAYVKTFLWIGENAGRQAIVVEPAYIEDFTRMRLEIRQGFGSRSIEEKNLIQGLFLCAYAVAHDEIPLEDAENFIRSTVACMEWKYITTNIDPGWVPLDAKATAEFTKTATDVLSRCIAFIESPQAQRQPPESFGEVVSKAPSLQYPYCFYTMDRERWITGLRDIVWKSYPEFEFLSGQQGAGITLFFGPHGAGKTTNMFSLLARAVWGGTLGLILKSDSRNQGCYLCLPSFEDPEVEVFLREKMGVEPHGLPTLILDVVRPNEYELLKGFPVTKYDRIIEIVDPNDLGDLDFGKIVKAAKEVHDLYPDPKPEGMVIVVRYLNRQRFGGEENADLTISANLIMKEAQWRMNNRKPPIFQLFDEIRGMLPRSLTRGAAGSETSRMIGQLSQMLDDTRGFNYSMVGTTLHPVMVVGEWVELATNIFFKGLSRNQADFLLGRGRQPGMLDIVDDSERDVVAKYLAFKTFQDSRIWFCYDRNTGRISLLRACPCPSHLEATTRDPHEAYRYIENKTHQDILIPKSKMNAQFWDEIRIARAEPSGQRPPRPEGVPDLEIFEA